jgi:hypothetical protein
VDPDGAIINRITSFYKQESNPWRSEYINENAEYTIGDYGCAMTGLANIITTQRSKNMSTNSTVLSKIGVTPRHLNKPANFDGVDLQWNIAASGYGLGAERIYNSSVAQQKIIEANTSSEAVSILAHVPWSYKIGDEIIETSHWLGIDGALIDLNSDGNYWIKVSATQASDMNQTRADYNENWEKVGNDMYIKLSAVKGITTIQ